MSNKETLLVAAVQDEPVSGDIDANIRKVLTHISDASERGVDIIVFPEKFLSGYEPDLIHSAPEKFTFKYENDVRLSPISDICRQNNVTVIVGAATYKNDDLFISSLIFTPDCVTPYIYNKMHLFETEQEIYKCGDTYSVIDIKGWKIGMGICYDSGFPEHAGKLAEFGCDAYFCSALFSKGNGYKEIQEWFHARASDNNIYVLLSNHVGTTGGWEACGHSAVWDTSGEIIAVGSESMAEMVIAELASKTLSKTLTNSDSVNIIKVDK
jgi:predicted amidohydrolase